MRGSGRLPRHRLLANRGLKRSVQEPGCSIFFPALDRWDDGFASEGIRCSPGPAILAVRALAGEGDVGDALRQIEEQIAPVLMIFRGQRYGTVAKVRSEL
jgi:hypothetical protein